jgi:hypothetical protein
VRLPDALDSTGAARRLLRGRHVVFIGNSVQRRAMYALADLLGGDNATRLPKYSSASSISAERYLISQMRGGSTRVPCLFLLSA